MHVAVRVVVVMVTVIVMHVCMHTAIHRCLVDWSRHDLVWKPCSS